MKDINLRYWLCQILGWGVWGLIISYFNLIVYGERFEGGGKKEFILSLSIFLLLGILSTHLTRTILKKVNWMRFQANVTFLIFAGAVAFTGSVLFLGSNFADSKYKYSFDNYQKNKRLNKADSLEKAAGLANQEYFRKSEPELDSTTRKAVTAIKKQTQWYRDKKGKWTYAENNNLLAFYQNLILVTIWMLLYFGYHYVENNRKNLLAKLKLESTVKELELKTIKSHINPHFIFNALNSIRALVDENPARARTAITELSNILRSSMQAEKMETVPLKSELSIVKDYLELEHMRFEERLKIEMDIDPDTLGQQVPPMMLQTLVENAIKHGVSKNVSGGYVRISSRFVGDHHELTVQNNGQLNGYKNKDGFGLKSTEDRLNLLYHGKAGFILKNLTDHSVESKVILPLTINKPNYV